MIWLIGNKGMLGQQISLLLTQRGIKFIGSDRELSILDSAALQAFIECHRPDWIVNCAAYTAVDKAEDEPDLAFALNAQGPANLAALAKTHGIALLHLSTDYVFDGLGIPNSEGKLRPYQESDPTNPQAVYARTKAQGEELVRASGAHHIILRTAWLYGKFGPNFVYSMLRLMRQRTELGIVGDQFGSPTWAWDLSNAILTIITASTPVWGTFHFSNDGIISWYDFAVEIHRLGRSLGIIERDCSLSALNSNQYPSKVKRPAWSVLDKAAIVSNYGLGIPDWQESIGHFMSELAVDWQDNPYIVPREDNNK